MERRGVGVRERWEVQCAERRAYLRRLFDASPRQRRVEDAGEAGRDVRAQSASRGRLTRLRRRTCLPHSFPTVRAAPERAVERRTVRREVGLGGVDEGRGTRTVPGLVARDELLGLSTGDPTSLADMRAQRERSGIAKRRGRRRAMQEIDV